MNINSDKKFMSYAINLAKKNLGTTSPNPVVSCVIVKDDEIISTGITAKNGRPHAEEIAIEKVLNKTDGKSLLKNSTIYVTLEPCAHFGQTPPCVDKIIKNEIAKVVIASTDPDLRVNTKGIKKLQEANIEVKVGVLEKEARELNKGFFKVKTTGLPYITLKLATSLDAKIATKDFHSKWITGQKARDFSHYLRSVNDAIMIGSNTAKKDNPMLDCRLPGLKQHSPKRIIISNKAELSDDLNLLKTANEIPTIILTSNKNIKFNSDIKLILCEEKNGKIDLKSAFKKLAENEINSILVEGGQNLATQLLQENLVDELIWIRNKKIIGQDGIDAIGKMGFSSIDEVIQNFKKSEILELEEDVIEIFSV